MEQVFETEKIRFVRVSERLVPDYLLMVNDIERVDRYISGWHEPFTEEQEIAWVRRKLEEGAAVFSMIEKESGAFIGNIELTEPAERTGELGVAITAAQQDRGYGTEAVLGMVRYGLDRLGLKRIFLRTSPENARAIHVYEKCGFCEYDRTETHVYMGLVR
ncbi:MAG: GNAT family N-acetyltransferase [Oscillospiraceae bacterium]|nr:GNAT family N-acetyltransferase [Oscillospiraceae bacterium]